MRSVLLLTLFLMLGENGMAAVGDCETYESCRDDFKNAVAHVAQQLPLKLVQFSTPIPNRENADLTIDSALFVAPESERILVLSSGLHGVEAFVGSRLQKYFLLEVLPALHNNNTSVLLIHALNPWGFKNKRRTSENNVDLNRNFSLQPDLYGHKNPEYMQLSDFLNPKAKAKVGWWAGGEYVFHAIRYILQYGMTALRKAILVGQYQEKTGIFFGGTAAEPNVSLVQEHWQKALLEVSKISNKNQRIMAIDLHTGYGQKAKLHLLIDRNVEVNRPKLEKVFGADSLDAGSKKEFYDVTGGYLTWVSQWLNGDKQVEEISAITFEFGTLDSQTTGGALDSLYRMQKENQAYHHGAASDTDAFAIRQFFVEMYNPTDENWNTAAKSQFKTRMMQVWSGL